jgi:flagellar L-ring protein precursor FlgH
MIGKREYKVIVTGLIRPEDFNDAGIISEKLLDPQYDVVSLRKTKSNE